MEYSRRRPPPVDDHFFLRGGWSPTEGSTAVSTKSYRWILSHFLILKLEFSLSSYQRECLLFVLPNYLTSSVCEKRTNALVNNRRHSFYSKVSINECCTKVFLPFIFSACETTFIKACSSAKSLWFWHMKIFPFWTNKPKSSTVKTVLKGCWYLKVSMSRGFCSFYMQNCTKYLT